MLRRLSLCLALCACAKPAITGPSNAVKLEVERAEAAEEKRQHDIARRHYEAAIDRAEDPISEAFARREFAETLSTWGEVESAHRQLEKSVVKNPSDPIAWQMLGILRASDTVKDTAGAFEAFERSKQLAPRAWIPRRDLAALHFKLGAGRDADPDPAAAAKHREAALAEYKAMLELDLPPRLREKVKWGIEVLSSYKPEPAPEAPAPPPSP
jgi:tetratricopeptide (TPR) repeat protein